MEGGRDSLKISNYKSFQLRLAFVLLFIVYILRYSFGQNFFFLFLGKERGVTTCKCVFDQEVGTHLQCLVSVLFYCGDINFQKISDAQIKHKNFKW